MGSCRGSALVERRTRLSHVRPVDDWSKTDGRIYRVRPKDAKVGLQPFNLHTAPVAELIAKQTRRHFVRENASSVGVKRIREIIDEAANRLELEGKRTILFLDEIHRFNKLTLQRPNDVLPRTAQARLA